MMEQMLQDAAQRIFRDHCHKAALEAAEAGEFPTALWRALCENGFHQLALPDSGVEFADVFRVLRVAGRHAAPLPLAEALLANRWLANEDDGLASIGRIAASGQGSAQTWLDAPWGRAAQRIVGVAEDGALFVGVPVKVTAGASLSGEPRDEVAVRDIRSLPSSEPVQALLALSRVALSAGALDSVLEMGVAYAQQREQFGRPIAAFQAVQHMLAAAAGETAAASRAADAAMAAIGTDRLVLEVAAAKARVGEAAGIVAETVHQVHGAMGFTYEHQLHHFTRRLWAWREEYGNEAHWQALLGRHICKLGADGLWPFLTTER